MTALRTFGRWVADWRTGATVVGSVLVLLLAFTVIDGAQARQDAIDAQRRTSATATRRIDLLSDEIRALRGDAEANGQRIAELTAEVAALQGQVRQLGGTPVVPVTTTAPRPTPTTSPPAPPPPPPPPPSTTTTTTTPRRSCIAGVICPGG